MYLKESYQFGFNAMIDNRPFENKELLLLSSRAQLGAISDGLSETKQAHRERGKSGSRGGGSDNRCQISELELNVFESRKHRDVIGVEYIRWRLGESRSVVANAVE